MLLGIKAWIYGKLTADATLQTALGGAGKIKYYYPNDFQSLPVLTYSEVNQRNLDGAFFDNTYTAVETVIELHVWSNASTTTIATAAANVMLANLFTMDSSQDVADPDSKIQHRVMRFRRLIRATEID